MGAPDAGRVDAGHLAPSFITEAIRGSAPVYGITEPKKVVALHD